MSANQRDWAKLLDIAQFSYNLQKSESTHMSPFELATGPLTPNTVATGYTGKSPAASKFSIINFLRGGIRSPTWPNHILQRRPRR